MLIFDCNPSKLSLDNITIILQMDIYIFFNYNNF